MTVSHRKNKALAKPDDGKLGGFSCFCSCSLQLALADSNFSISTQLAVEPGIRYHCDACGADITLTVRVRCAGGCEDFDVCGSCFCAGVEVRHHKAWHDYRIVVSLPFVIWSAERRKHKGLLTHIASVCVGTTCVPDFL
mgnify:CR=1 FL=1